VLSENGPFVTAIETIVMQRRGTEFNTLLVLVAEAGNTSVKQPRK